MSPEILLEFRKGKIMSEEKQSISSEEVGSIEDVLGENDPLLRPKLETEPEPELEPKEMVWKKNCWVEK